MIGYLVDSDILIWVIRGLSPLVEFLDRLAVEDSQGRPAVSVISAYEVLVGEASARREDAWRLLTLALRPLEVTPQIAAVGAALSQDERRHGRALHMADALIAATALIYDLTLVTYNVSHFDPLGVHLYGDLPEL